jgi:mono/diheme cytochrome c family protein
MLYGLVVYDRSWDVPLPNTRASSDPELVARGEYLVYGPGHCADCHSPPSERDALFAGEIVPLTGGIEEDTWLGRWMAPNLTADTLTGIGALSDGQLARMMRHGVNRDDRISLPFTDSFADLTEEDLVAILSYLRTLEPEEGVGPASEVNLWGKITLAYFLEPYGPVETPRASIPPGPSVEYGRYLANTIGRCGSCHTPRNLKTGEYLGPRFSGGLPFDSRENPGTAYITPNLTPDPATGHIVGWSEEEFLTRMKGGTTIDDSPMPWGSFGRMTEDDLRAIYRYLQSLEPVEHPVGPIVQRKD